MSKGIAFLAGLGAGYFKEEDRKEERESRKKREQREQELHDMQMSELRQSASDRAALRAAAAPVDVVPVGEKPETMDNRDVGQPGEAPVPITGYRVGARQFAERGVADTEAAAQNDPKAVRSRVMRTLAGQGKVLEADQLRNSGIAGEAAQMNLDQAIRKVRDEGMSRALSAALGGASPQEVEQLYNAQGERKVSGVRIEPFETNHPVLGKARSARITGVNEKGEPFEIKDALATSFSMFSAEKQLDAQFKAKDDARADRQVDIAQQQANTQEQYRRDQAENMRKQRELQAAQEQRIAAGKTKPGDPIEVTIKDMRDFEGDLNGYIKDQYPVKEGADEKERASINAQATAKKAQGSAIFRSNAAVGIPLTAGTVLQAMELAADRKNVRIAQVNGTPHEAVVVNGQVVIVSGPMERRPAPQPQPAPQAPTTPAAAARAGVEPAPRAAPAAPAIDPKKAAAMAPLNEAVQRAAAMLAAAAQSGDPQAVAKYAPAVQQARDARMREAVRLFGPNEAQAYLSTLPQ